MAKILSINSDIIAEDEDKYIRQLCVEYKDNLRRADLRRADLRWADLRWADLRWADLRRANLSGADLRWADLRRANLEEADLRRANLEEADLRNALLSRANLEGAALPFGRIPIIENVDKAILEASQNGELLDMSAWHCGTSHCRAGWAINLAGEAGYLLESIFSSDIAGALIYAASGSHPVPDWMATDKEALGDMISRANNDE